MHRPFKIFHHLEIDKVTQWMNLQAGEIEEDLSVQTIYLRLSHLNNIIIKRISQPLVNRHKQVEVEVVVEVLLIKLQTKQPLLWQQTKKNQQTQPQMMIHSLLVIWLPKDGKVALVVNIITRGKG